MTITEFNSMFQFIFNLNWNTMLNKIVLLSCFVAITFSQHIVHHQCPVRPILQSFNLTQYLGRWYEISRYEQRFSLNCDCGFADYTLNPDGTVHVRNCCKRLPNTTESCVVGKAALSNPNDNPIPGKLSVAFRGRKNFYFSLKFSLD